jgi:glucokinase
MILAGDIGGTKTLIGLFDYGDHRPVPVETRSFTTTDYPGLPAIIDDFYAQHGSRPRVVSAAFGVAGPVINQSAQMTNVEWTVNADELVHGFGFERVRLVNDLEAMAYSVAVLERAELETLQDGTPRPDGNMALIAAGTGLGQAILHRLGDRLAPVASEGGHADFAARSDRELELVRYLRERFGRAEVEHVVSGPGLLNLADFTHQAERCAALSAIEQSPVPDAPAEISRAALAGECPQCVEALGLLIGAYGASAGNLALTAVTTGGVFIGGGIAPKILPALADGRFIAAFNAKGPMRPLLEAMQVQVILNADAGLLGAAVYAQQQVRGHAVR